MKILERGKLIDLPDKEINEDEGDGWCTLHEWLTQKVTTQGCIAIFPYLPFWPSEKKIKKINIELFHSSLIAPEFLNDKKIIFWPSELRNFALGRPQDIILGKRITTTLSFLCEIKEYLINYYPNADYWITIIGTDLHLPRILRDFQKVFSGVEKKIIVTPTVVRIHFPIFSRKWFLKKIFRVKETAILLVSTFMWNWYYKSSLKKGRKV